MTGKEYVERVNPKMVFCIDDYFREARTTLGPAYPDWGFCDTMDDLWPKEILSSMRAALTRDRIELKPTIPAVVNSAVRGWTKEMLPVNANHGDAMILADIDSMNYPYVSAVNAILDRFYNEDNFGMLYLFTKKTADKYEDALKRISKKIIDMLSLGFDVNNAYEIDLTATENGIIIVTSPVLMAEFLKNEFKDICTSLSAEDLREVMYGFSQIVMFDKANAVLLRELGVAKVSKNGDQLKIAKGIKILLSDLPVHANDYDEKQLQVPTKTTWSPLKFADCMLEKTGYCMSLVGIDPESKFPNPKRVMRMTSCADHYCHGFYGTGVERKAALERVIEFCMKNGNMQAPVPTGIKRETRRERKIIVS